MNATISNTLIVVATLAGPILAVQAQKWIERARQVTNRKEYVFATLMATRGARLDPEHVRALNMIDLAFYGSKIGGRPFRNAKCQAVLNNWREYLDRLSTDISNFEVDQINAFLASNDELFINLLAAIADERGLEFDRVTLKKGSYHPNAMRTSYDEGNALRAKALAVLSGEQPIKVAYDPPVPVGE